MTESTVRRTAEERSPADAPGTPRHDHPRLVRDEHADSPRMEPWLWWGMAALVPVAFTMFVPPSFVAALCAASGALLVTSVAMLIVQERRKSRRA